MRVVKRKDIITNEYRYGVTDLTVCNGVQLYPYDTKAEAELNKKLQQIKNNPKDPRFLDPVYVGTLKALNRL